VKLPSNGLVFNVWHTKEKTEKHEEKEKKFSGSHFSQKGRGGGATKTPVCLHH
jgi:hypothetical protein